MLLLKNQGKILAKLLAQKKSYFLVAIGLVLILKIFLAAVFSSGYQDQIFIPFVQYFTSHSNLDPWQYFYANNQAVAFPYPPLMLYILAPFYSFIKLFNITNPLAINLIFKIPLLISDIAIFSILLRMCPNKRINFYIYFLSPIAIYVSYIHSQLDIIPTALLLGSIYYLLKNRLLSSALVFAYAILTKSNILIAFPLILIYLFRNTSFRNILIYGAVVGTTYLVASIPFIFGCGYQHFVFGGKEQSLVLNLYQRIDNLKIYWILVTVLLMYVRFFAYKKINHDLFLGYITLGFILLLIMVYPIPSWYVWITPYLCIFIISARKYRKYSLMLYIGLIVVYLIYSLFFFKHPFSNLSNITFFGEDLNSGFNFGRKATNITFTLLEAIMIVLMYSIYKTSIKSNEIYKKKDFATTIGIGGDSGSGKTTMLRLITDVLGKKQLLELEGDGEHKWERGDKNWSNFTHLDPRANKLHDQFQIVKMLKSGFSVKRKDYNHSTGKFIKATLINPKPYVAISGLHPFYLPKARKLIDIKIYLEPEEKLRQHWKIIRDENRRGYTKNQILEQLSVREKDRIKYILPQEKYSDLSFKIISQEEFEVGKKDIKIDTRMLIKIDSNFVLDDLYEELHRIKGLEFSYDYSDNLEKQEILIHGKITSNQIAKIAHLTIENIGELIDLNPVWHDGYAGIKQLFTLIAISEFLKQDSGG